jgi:transposase
MYFVGIDLHKKTITLCVVNQAREVTHRRKFACAEPQRIRQFFAQLGPFQAVVEATSSYEWLWQLLEPLAQRLVLAHPKKLRIIAESTRKSDKLDAFVLADFLALGMIPESYRPTPRQRQHRTLVRQRYFLRRQTTALKNRIRHLVAHYNADRKDLFSAEGQEYLAGLTIEPVDRYVLEQMLQTWRHLEAQRQKLDKALAVFAKKAPAAEKEARDVLRSMPNVGVVTVDSVLSEVADIQRFRSINQVAAYAGLAPGFRESDKHRRELGISKEGSPLLRWALVETAWRMVRCSRRWQTIFDALRKRRGKKKAIVAVARRLLVVMATLWRTGQKYRLAG